MRIGHGYDSHRFVERRRLVLGCVEIPFDRGLEGWSDADAVAHALIDALCGAAGLGDIGTLFPPGVERFRGISSADLLQDVARRIAERRLAVVNADVTVIAEQPFLSPHVPRMRTALAAALQLDENCVSVKAKTNEGMGFVGRSEGIAALAVVLLEPAPEA